MAYQTGWCALHHRTSLRAGETLLVHAAAGGVGAAAVQLGLAAGARVIATVGSADKAEVARRLGAHEVIVLGRTARRRRPDPGGEGPDRRAGRRRRLRPVGGDTFDASRRVTAWEGRLLVIGFAGGRIADAPTNHALVKNYDVVGVHWAAYRTRAPSWSWRWRRRARGAVGAASHRPAGRRRSTRWRDLPDALDAIAARTTTGRVVVTP